MIQEIMKENTLLKEYVKTLEKQVKANADERSALCKQMSNINQQNLQLNRRISVQPPQGPTQAALQHYEERFKSECIKNMTITKEFTILKVKMEELLNNSSEKQRRIQKLIKENNQVITKDSIINDMEGQLKSQEEEARRLKLQVSQKKKVEERLYQMQQLLNKEIKQKMIATNQSQQQLCQIQCLSQDLQQLKSNIKKLQLQQKQHKSERAQLKQDNTHFQSIVKALYQEKDSLYKLLEQKQANLIKTMDQNAAFTNEINLLLQQRQSLVEQIAQISDEKNILEQANECISQNLESAKIQVEQLSNEIKQYVNDKVHQKSKKNRTQNCFKTHYEFNNAFKELKIQIQAIKSEHEPLSKPQQQIQQHKQNTPTYDSNSPSKWKSVQGKLFMLRSTQSMSRFR